jgi:hypothetical protein
VFEECLDKVRIFIQGVLYFTSIVLCSLFIVISSYKCHKDICSISSCYGVLVNLISNLNLKLSNLPSTGYTYDTASSHSEGVFQRHVIPYYSMIFSLQIMGSCERN